MSKKNNNNQHLKQRIREQQQEINKLGTTVLVVTHAKDLVEQFSHRVIAIDDGLIVSDGMDGYYSYENQ